MEIIIEDVVTGEVTRSPGYVLTAEVLESLESFEAFLAMIAAE